ncbi:MAG: DEAD/DEAH box helicase [Anaerolineaceae bacterium]|jgi:DEAD/DEAH box helicase domain-containing protein
MSISDLLDTWSQDPLFSEQITCWVKTPAQNTMEAAFPDDLPSILADKLRENGISSLYQHQLVAYRHACDGRNVVISTGTASGKTLCYNLPILKSILEEGSGNALFLFPTKALAQDQLLVLKELIPIGADQPRIEAAIYDSDTPQHHRAAIRKGVSLLITNPDMFHQGILPHHTLWQSLFSKLRYVVLDEMHIYRGVFGSHIANVIRRLKRISAFYKSFPQFILTSATIGNPRELAENLIESPVELVENDGSPRGTRHFLIYNPPLVDEKLGLRKSSMLESVRICKRLIDSGVQTIMFARTRRSVEMLLTYLLNTLPIQQHKQVRGYRSGYLKAERREIEKALKNGDLRAVVATSALELGIDIGNLESALIVGYPGSVATTRQRAGRAGRKNQDSLALMVVTPDAMDQYLANHSEYITGNSPENALIDANNLSILLQHLRCAAFELPFRADESYGSVPIPTLQMFFQMLTASGEMNQQANKFYWVGDAYPSAELSLRSTTSSRVTLQVAGQEKNQLVGEIDTSSASWLVHPQAIYLHEAESYEVLSLDLENGVCLLEPSTKDYFTIPQRSTTIENFTLKQSFDKASHLSCFGEISLRMQVNSFRKVRWFTNETIGAGPVDLPPYHLDTTGFWMTLSESLLSSLRASGDWSNDPNDYGPGWKKLAKRVMLRDRYQCRVCSTKTDASQLHVHHIRPFREFPDLAAANQPSNLITLCPSCHRQAELNVHIRSGLAGACNALRNLAPLLIMCDREDIGLFSETKSILAEGKPAILVYDNIPGGLGLSRKLFELESDWVSKAVEMIAECTCENGCPACVGPVGDTGYGGKKEALALLRGLL